MRLPSPLGGAPEEREEHEVTHPDESYLEREWQFRKHFPHLSKSVAPRESDEYPTCVEE